MNPIVRDAVVAAFVADALSLGVHWVYVIHRKLMQGMAGWNRW